MALHKSLGPNGKYPFWVIGVVVVCLELTFGIISVFDARRGDPKERMFNSKIFNLPVFTITIIIITLIFMNKPEAYAIVYGAICGGFAGYLAGGLAYAKFFIRIKDDIYRIVFGGWIGVLLGAIFGSLFAYLLDPLNGKVFGGLFMGFWGGAIVSGPIATILLYLFRKKEKFTQFFTKLLLYDMIIQVSNDLRNYFSVKNKGKTPRKLLLDDCEVFKAEADEEINLKVNDKKGQSFKQKFSRFLRIVYKIFIYILFLTNPWELSKNALKIESFNTIFKLAAEKENLHVINRTIVEKIKI